MCKFFYLTKGRPKSKIRAPKRKLFWNLKGARILIVVLVLAVGLVYIVQINNLATKGYQIKNLEQKISDLKIVSKELEDKILTRQSIQEVNEQVAKLGMEKVTEVEYLVPKREQVVVGY